MKKHYILFIACCLAAVSAWADTSVTETYITVSQTSSSGAAGSNWVGVVCDWTTKYARRGSNDKLNGQQCTWITLDGTSVRGYIKTTNLEGGIKDVSFYYGQFGAEATTVLKWQVSAIGTTTISDIIERDGDLGENKSTNGDSYSHSFNCKENAQLEILNMSEMDNGNMPANGKARLLVNNVTITPYLLYKTKAAAAQLVEGTVTYTNTDLIDNTDGEGAIVYSLSDNEIGATINAETGAVTATAVGTVTVIASWEDVTTSYTLHICDKVETFESATETTSTYANPAESTEGDIATWTCQIGGVKHMTDDNYKPMFGETKYAIFRAPRTTETKTPYIESDIIEGGIGSLTFSVNPTAPEAATTWDIRVFINGEQVGENYGGFGTAPQYKWTTITIPNININGEFVIRFENHSTIDGEYTSGNKGRLAIDNIGITGYCNDYYGILVDGTDFVVGTRTAQDQYPEYMVTVDLEKDQTIKLYDKCNEAAFLPNGQQEGGYWFNVDGENWSAPAKGKYTIYIKMYGYNNNWIYTTYQEPTPTAIDNTAAKRDIRKEIVNGQLVITKNGVQYNVLGTKL